MASHCPRCAFHFNRVPGHWLGSWFLNVLVTQGVVVLILVVVGAATWPDVPVMAMTIAAGAAAVLVPLAFFPFARTIWVAIELAMRPLELDEGVAPGFELEPDILESLDVEDERVFTLHLRAGRRLQARFDAVE